MSYDMGFPRCSPIILDIEYRSLHRFLHIRYAHQSLGQLPLRKILQINRTKVLTFPFLCPRIIGVGKPYNIFLGEGNANEYQSEHNRSIAGWQQKTVLPSY